MTLLSDYRLFPDIYGSEGSIAICLRCGGIFNKLLHYTFTAESLVKKFKFCQHLAKLLARVGCPVFLLMGYIFST